MSQYKKKSLAELSRLSAEDALQAPKKPLIVVLDNIRSMQNVGAILRSADAFGVRRVILLGITPTPPHREIRKSAIGAEDSVDWKFAENWTEAKTILPDEYILAPLEQTTESLPLSGYRPQPRVHVVVVGNEVKGVSEEILGEADLTLEIEQYGHKHSLNVATSAGIVMYHLCEAFPIS